MSRRESEYYTGRKNQWRRSIYNSIIKRLGRSPRDSTVLYLGADGDLDREVAISKGFRSYNLICVERKADIVRTIRNSGALCIRGDFFEAAFSIINSQAIDVIFGDLMGGLYASTIEKIMGLMCHPNTYQSVFSFNFLRGREKDTNEERDQSLKAIGQEKATKHRGALLMTCIANRYLKRRIKYELVNPNDRTAVENELKFCLFSMLGKPPINGNYFSYKSPPQTFDSVVFNNFMRKMHVDDPRGLRNLFTSRLNELSSKRTTMSARAVLAHRTMRINGTFPAIRR